jgi:hypothetical protein
MGWFTRLETAAADKLKSAFVDAKRIAEHCEADIAHAEQALQAAKVKAAKAAQTASQAAQAAAERARADVARAIALADALEAEAQQAATKADAILNHATPDVSVPVAVAPVTTATSAITTVSGLTPAQAEQATDPEAPPLATSQS